MEPELAKLYKNYFIDLNVSQLGMFTTDGWLNYQQQLPHLKHLVGKIFTQRIERHNLTLRTPIKRLARKTICFSKSIEVHEKIIGAYLNKFHYQSL